MTPPRAKPYTALDVAGFCGITLLTLYRSRERRHLIDRLPRPYSTQPLCWDRAAIDAWRAGMVQPRPANDVVPVEPPQTGAEHRAFLHQHYGAQR